MASASSQGLLPQYSTERGFEFLQPTPPRIETSLGFGMQETVDLSNDLLLVRTDFRTLPPHAARGNRLDYDLRGWLYLHFRLDGVSEDETPDGESRTLGGERFFLSASSQQRPFGREVLSEQWRTVGIACQPAFLMRDVPAAGHELPPELRRFQAGDRDIDFWYTGRLTHDMRLAVGALLRPAMPGTVRRIYLRAKVIELTCLALEQLRHPEAMMGALAKLSQRDVQSLQEAQRLLQKGSAALSLEQLARQVGLNRTKLALGFKQVFGVTVGEYYRELRLEVARAMLEKQAISVGEAAAAAGYCDAGSFTKAFRARYGSLPSELKNLMSAAIPTKE